MFRFLKWVPRPAKLPEMTSKCENLVLPCPVVQVVPEIMSDEEDDATDNEQEIPQPLLPGRASAKELYAHFYGRRLNRDGV